MFIVYESDMLSRNLNTGFMPSDFTDFTPVLHCVSGAIKLMKNADKDKYEYSGYGIGFDACSLFSVNMLLCR